jgi:hypothetical protein
MRKFDYALTCLGFIALTLTNLSHAAPQAQTANKQREDKPEHVRREPPAQAYELCKNKKEGDAVEIVTPRGDKLKGSCTDSPKGLFARPEHPPEDKAGDERRPPPKK